MLKPNESKTFSAKILNEKRFLQLIDAGEYELRIIFSTNSGIARSESILFDRSNIVKVIVLEFRS